jgi:predicted permease
MTVSVRGTASGRADRREPFFAELVRRVGALGGVQAASAVNHLPMHGDHWHFPFFIEGSPPPRRGEEQGATFRIARPGYFATMRIPLVDGREFSEQDQRSRERVVLVNEAMARRRWPGASAIGRRLSVSDPARGAEWYTVIGVAREVRQGRWTEESSEEMYFPHLDLGADSTAASSLEWLLDPSYLTLVIRTRSDPAPLTPAVRALVRSMEPDAPVSGVITMERVVHEQFAAPRFYLLLFGAFAAVALVLAVVGVYGVMSYGVATRTREIGLRLALGATRGRAFGMVVRQGMRLSLIGTVVGLLAALMLTRYLATLLYRVPPIDVPTFTVVAILLSLVALAASAIPARRATRIDPMVALRGE